VWLSGLAAEPGDEQPAASRAAAAALATASRYEDLTSASGKLRLSPKRWRRPERAKSAG